MSDPLLPPAERRIIPKWQVVVAGVLLALVLATPLWGPRALSHFAFFRVRKVEVLGARYTPAADVLSRLRADTSMSIWDPLGPFVDRVGAHPQVAHVTITRKLPGTLVVAITERKPVALVPSHDGLRAVDEEGRALPLDPSRTPIDAPVVSTPPRDTSVYHLLGRMQRSAPALYAQVSTITSAGAGEMIVTISQVPVRAMTSVTLARLSDIEPVEQDLLRRQMHVSELDLRYRDQVIARLP